MSKRPEWQTDTRILYFKEINAYMIRTENLISLNGLRIDTTFEALLCRRN